MDNRNSTMDLLDSPASATDIPADEILGAANKPAFFGSDGRLTIDNNLDYNGTTFGIGVPGNISLGAALDISLISDDVFISGATSVDISGLDLLIDFADDITIDAADTLSLIAGGASIVLDESGTTDSIIATSSDFTVNADDDINFSTGAALFRLQESGAATDITGSIDDAAFQLSEDIFGNHSFIVSMGGLDSLSFNDQGNFNLTATDEILIDAENEIRLTLDTSSIAITKNGLVDDVTITASGVYSVQATDNLLMHSDTFIELDCDGNLDMYGTSGISLNSEASIQLQATSGVTIATGSFSIDATSVSFGYLSPTAEVNTATHYVEMVFDGTPMKVLMTPV